MKLELELDFLFDMLNKLPKEKAKLVMDNIIAMRDDFSAEHINIMGDTIIFFNDEGEYINEYDVVTEEMMEEL